MSELLKVEGLAKQHIKKLQKADIRTPKKVLSQSLSESDRRKLSENTGVPEGELYRVAGIAELMSIKGVGYDYSDLLVRSGVDSIATLQTRKPKELLATLVKVDAGGKVTKKIPTSKQVTAWISQAKKMDAKLVADAGVTQSKKEKETTKKTSVKETKKEALASLKSNGHTCSIDDPNGCLKCQCGPWCFSFCLIAFLVGIFYGWNHYALFSVAAFFVVFLSGIIVLWCSHMLSSRRWFFCTLAKACRIIAWFFFGLALPFLFYYDSSAHESLEDTAPEPQIDALAYVDTDNDGISDAVEGTQDFDGDGEANFKDDDSDNDLIDDKDEGIGDHDGDGMPDFLDNDSDNDGLKDNEETPGDDDGDGIDNRYDYEGGASDSSPESGGDLDVAEVGAKSCEGPLSNGNWYKKCESTTDLEGFDAFAKNAVCEGFVTEQPSSEAYRFEDPALRTGVYKVALRMSRSFESGRNWKELSFIGGRYISRGEAMASLLSATCLLEVNLKKNDWKDTVYAFAQENKLTTRSQEEFAMDENILRQDLFVLIGRISDIAEQSGGCTQKAEVCQ